MVNGETCFMCWCKGFCQLGAEIWLYFNEKPTTYFLHAVLTQSNLYSAFFTSKSEILILKHCKQVNGKFAWP